MSSPGDFSSMEPEPANRRPPKRSRSRNRHDQRAPKANKKFKLREHETYHYDDLPKKRGAIRLLKLMPSRDDISEINCELLTPRQGQSTQPPYEALSWCWGVADKTSYINIRAKHKIYAKFISLNLFAALKALRHPDRDRYLWIDNICINQENLQEKNHQVEMMHEIYGNADRVCIWLGEENPSSRKAIKFIKEDVLQLQDFDTLCDSEHTSEKWRALLELMQRAWFSRRWVVQEIALARKAIIYCGRDKISWNKFAIAVELFVEVETATHRLSEVMKKDRQDDYLPGWFEYVSALGASLLVDATERLFRDYKDERKPLMPKDEHEHTSDLDSDSDSAASDFSELGSPKSTSSHSSGQWKIISEVKKHRVQPLLSLEYLVSSLTIFETTVPHDTIYALLAIAKDTTPSAARSDLVQSTHHARAGLEMFTQRKRYNVDYQLPYVDVCKEFIQFAIDRSLQIDRSRALDVILRPWATQEKVLKRQRDERKRKKKKEDKIEATKKAREEEKRKQLGIAISARGKEKEDAKMAVQDKGKNPKQAGTSKAPKTILSPAKTDQEDMPLPSWVPQLSEAPYGMHHGMAGPKMSRKYADPLVGLPSLTHRNYSAAENKGVDMKSLKFRKIAEDSIYSMYIRGFCLDEVQEVEQVAHNGQIPKEWAELGGWGEAKGAPPGAFWRTLVADRGRDGKNPPVYYSRACEESFKKGGFYSGAVDTTALINYGRNSIVAQFCRRVQAVVWNRAMIKTKAGRLGLVTKHVEKEDLICILYGCSVPVIFRRSERKTEEQFEKELEWELAFIQKTVVANFKQYKARKTEHKKRKSAEMVKMGRQWATKWLRDYHLNKPSINNIQELKAACKAYNCWYKETSVRRRKDEWKTLTENKESQETNMDEGLVHDAAAAQRDIRIAPQFTDASHGAAEQRWQDWRQFDTELKFGRRWKNIIRDRKAKEIAAWEKERLEQYRKIRIRRVLNDRKAKKIGEREHLVKKTIEELRQRHSLAPAAAKEDDMSHLNLLSNEDTHAGAEVAEQRHTNSPVNISNNHKEDPQKRKGLTDEDAADYDRKIRENIRQRLGDEGYYSYKLLGECYIHGMMDGEAMLHQNEGDASGVIPSRVFEIR